MFVPVAHWVRWPELMVSWHFAAIVIGTSALALALALQKPLALKLAIVLAAYIGLPSLLNLMHAIAEIHSSGNRAAVMFSYVVWGAGMLGQLAALLSCLARLVPIKRI